MATKRVLQGANDEKGLAPFGRARRLSPVFRAGDGRWCQAEVLGVLLGAQASLKGRWVAEFGSMLHAFTV